MSTTRKPGRPKLYRYARKIGIVESQLERWSASLTQVRHDAYERRNRETYLLLSEILDEVDSKLHTLKQRKPRK